MMVLRDTHVCRLAGLCLATLFAGPALSQAPPEGKELPKSAVGEADRAALTKKLRDVVVGTALPQWRDTVAAEFDAQMKASKTNWRRNSPWSLEGPLEFVFRPAIERIDRFDLKPQWLEKTGLAGSPMMSVPEAQKRAEDLVSSLLPAGWTFKLAPNTDPRVSDGTGSLVSFKSLTLCHGHQWGSGAGVDVSVDRFTGCVTRYGFGPGSATTARAEDCPPMDAARREEFLATVFSAYRRGKPFQQAVLNRKGIVIQIPDYVKAYETDRLRERVEKSEGILVGFLVLSGWAESGLPGHAGCSVDGATGLPLGVRTQTRQLTCTPQHHEIAPDLGEVVKAGTWIVPDKTGGKGFALAPAQVGATPTDDGICLFLSGDSLVCLHVDLPKRLVWAGQLGKVMAWSVPESAWPAIEEVVRNPGAPVATEKFQPPASPAPRAPVEPISRPR